MFYLGVDVGSVSTDFVIINGKLEVEETIYLRTKGSPANAIAQGMAQLSKKYKDDEIAAAGTTGSGRILAGSILGADVVKNEITAHGVAASSFDSSVRTILEIGGQDSKIILLENGVIKDFAMNSVCAAGTGSFLDRQAERMGMTIEEFSKIGLNSEHPVQIAGRCAVFAESDIIHKQQQGAAPGDIVAGISAAMVRNYLSNVGRGKKIKEPVIFQGGVASNAGIKKAFEKELNCDIQVPEHNKVMGAFGAAILAAEKAKQRETSKVSSTFFNSDVIPANLQKTTNFKGFNAGYADIDTRTFRCNDCNNNCEITELYEKENLLGRLYGRCGKYQAGSLN